jgi:hypothetical protein
LFFYWWMVGIEGFYRFNDRSHYQVSSKYSSRFIQFVTIRDSHPQQKPVPVADQFDIELLWMTKV